MQKLQLSIPEPCHENWQQMTPTEQGRFCNACAKEVIDFSTMTDIQVLNYFTNLTHEKVCGRALPEQLDKVISRPLQPKKKLFWYWNYFVMFFMLFGKGNSAKAQGEIKPVIQINPFKANDIRGRTTVVNGVIMKSSGVITGKVTDINGNPVSFASVKIKGTNSGVAADANGDYSIKVNTNAILIISAAGFKESEVIIGTQSVLNSVLEFNKNMLAGEVVIVSGDMGFIKMDNYQTPAKTNSVAIIKVKETETNKFIPNASVIINSLRSTDTIITDKKGEHRIKKIKKYDEYYIKVIADGYEPNEFTIDEADFKDRKKEWEVLLRKQKIEITTASPNVNTGKDFTIRIHCYKGLGVGTGALYVVDGTINPIGVDINPDDVEDYSILQGPAATALFGSAGSNGAVVITTKKLKIKNLDTVTVTSYPIQGALKKNWTTSETSVMGGMVKGETINVINTIADSMKILVTKLTGTIKIFPNPVQRGLQFSIALKLKQAGLYQLQITDAAGKIVLQKQFNANAKEVTEKLLADSRWASGLYYLNIFDNKNQLAGKTSFIFE